MAEYTTPTFSAQEGDLVDFRCSDSFLDFYQVQRLTKRCSGRRLRRPTPAEFRRHVLRETDERPLAVAVAPDQLLRLRRENANLKAQNRQLREEIERLRRKARAPKEGAFAGIPEIPYAKARN